jgi:hypothetical protein
MYSLEDYNNILFSGFSYKLPSDVLDSIQNLNETIGSMEPASSSTVPFVTTDSFHKDGKKGFRNNGYSKNITKRQSAEKARVPVESWERTPIFKYTKIEKKEGIEKIINDIRICVNKISNKNYDAQRDTILKHISDIMEKDDSSVSSSENEKPEDELETIANSLFDIASTNKFYSELYATLYKDLIQNYPLFQKIIPNFIQKYKDSMDNIEVIDPNSDYDKYCDNNKLNDKRKAMTAFIVNLMKQNIIEKSCVFEFLVFLQDRVAAFLDLPEKIGVVDEITENISIFITLSVAELSTESVWGEIVDNVILCSKLKAKEHPGISSRCVFKYMDILDSVNKATKENA